MTAAERRRRLANARTYAGYRQAHFSKATGTLVVVLDGKEAGLDTSWDSRWYTLCDDHSTIVSHSTLQLARAHSPDPDEWCDECREPGSGDPYRDDV